MTFYADCNIMALVDRKGKRTMSYQIITDATADLNEELLAGLPEVQIIPMLVQVNGREYIFGPGGNLTTEEFYRPRHWCPRRPRYHDCVLLGQ